MKAGRQPAGHKVTRTRQWTGRDTGRLGTEGDGLHAGGGGGGGGA